ncbi:MULTISPECIES: helix-turn-helix domain-containing protein [Mycobacteriaceae]|uniref:AraC family transcriptional regulator n=1 Tax=Mycolicibacterium neoaurum VKM Ac-1815D TaxID=700508 RepID=V5XHY0_MYCNE|nr:MULTISPECIES: helix-turn-helix domain-containing protein [Mycobacteriaceae]AHC27291.1 AraC family transcriptional regulator [Mycolicibacterium neoaurum VKM Ac-1815D]AMO07522.1 AraC family transcriptional regulator [Mycolicibacterium neoaurum]AXK74088.1 AraC family transcriptional regulator [Mycolicibacterium neoaurum]KJQ51476.1 AraC family transcriptional regulator [Mycolicibacterium neoaurum]KUM08948.1 AraC family transcriptional regulator [Mycolicibacterium neoaurum]
MHAVAILVYDGMTGFESGLAAEIFGMAELPGRFSAGVAPAGYAVKLCSEQPEIRMLGGAVVRTSYGIEDLANADTVLIPSVRDVEQAPSDDLLDAIRAADARGARLVSICSGAFALAAAGVLDGRTATTHWIYADLLAQRYPAIDVDPAPLYVDNGRVLTSAGCAAGLDLCLHIVRADHGVRVANDVARRLVISPHRAGGQAQYIETPVPEPTVDGRIAAGMAWALEHLDRPITLDELAERSSLSRRSYLRQFAKATGTTPIKWLIEQRIQASLALLESSDLGVEQIATRVGFESPVTFRHHFVRQMRTTPREYRGCFSG